MSQQPTRGRAGLAIWLPEGCSHEERQRRIVNALNAANERNRAAGGGELEVETIRDSEDGTLREIDLSGDVRASELRLPDIKQPTDTDAA